MRRVALLAAAIGAVALVGAAPVVADRSANPVPAAAGLLSGASALEPLLATKGPVVLHFWATWCEACVAELPALVKTFADAEKAGARVVFVSLDAPEDRAKKVPGFLAKHGWTSPGFVLDAPDPGPVAALVEPAWDGELPATFVFRDGRRVKSIIGPVKDPAELLAAVR